MPAAGQVVLVVAELIDSMHWAFNQSIDRPMGGAVGDVHHAPGLLVPVDGFPENPVDGDCDASLAFVNVLRRYRTTTGLFPAELGTESACNTERAALVQIGVARCSVALHPETGEPPSRERKEHEALVMQDDADRMDSALCRAVKRLTDAEVIQASVVNAWEPVGPQGGIVTGVQTVAFLFEQ